MRILIAEDNFFYRHMLVSTLNEWGYETVATADGNEAWAKLQRSDAPRLAILDWMMPGMEGPEVCRRLRALHKPEPTYIIMLTSKEGKENIVAALDSGADDYLTKPFDRGELRARLQVGLRIVGLQTSQAVVFAFARAVEAKSPYTQGHAERVTNYVLAMAERAGLGPGEKEILRQGGLLHDVGKICVPDTILEKPGDLSPEELAIIQLHPTQGATIVKPLHSMQHVIPLIRWHHERCDGQGYPDGLAGDEIPLLVRMLSVADIYDALSSKRPYRDAIPHQQCLRLLSENAASGGLDPELVRLFISEVRQASSATDDFLPVATSCSEQQGELEMETYRLS
jgi:putative two-component system response regulator